MNHPPTFPDEAVEKTAQLFCEREGWSWASVEAESQDEYRDEARMFLDALTPFLVQGRPCEACGGTGEVEDSQGGEMPVQYMPCIQCDGTGKRQPHPAPLSEQDREKLKQIAEHVEVDGNRLPDGILKNNCRRYSAFLRDLAERGEGR